MDEAELRHPITGGVSPVGSRIEMSVKGGRPARLCGDGYGGALRCTTLRRTRSASAVAGCPCGERCPLGQAREPKTHSGGIGRDLVRRYHAETLP